MRPQDRVTKIMMGSFKSPHVKREASMMEDEITTCSSNDIGKYTLFT